MRNYLKTGIFMLVCLMLTQIAFGQKETKKNLLFIITDQQRYDALSYTGNAVINTPNMDRLARQGAYFQNAYTPCAVCGPARSSILTGSSVERTGVNSNEQTYYYSGEGVMTMPTFDEILAENGYHCEYYGKWHSMSSHASVYKNPQLVSESGHSIFGPGGQSYIWHDYLALAGAPPTPGDGQFIDGMSKWPYIANPLDRFYGMSYQQLLASNLVHTQPDQHGELLLNEEYTMTTFQGMQAVEAIERLKDSTFSLTVSFHFPHAPMLPPQPYYGMYPVDEMMPPVSINDDMQNSPYLSSNGRLNRTEYADPDKIKYMISEYYGLITEIDDWVGNILDKLDSLGIADNTMIIFTSDHGEMLGAHGMREKNVFYEESAHIPLLISSPGEIAAETQVDGYVSNIDLFPTILDYLNVQEHESDGTSLRGLINGTDTTHGKYVVTEWDRDNTPNYMVVSEGWKLIIPYKISSNVINTMYDLNTDPHEMNNLLGSNPDRAQYIEKAEELRACLVEWLEKRKSIHTYSVAQRDLLNGGKPTGNNAAFVSQEIPELIAGETISVSITMKNTGVTAWTQRGQFKLGSQGPANNKNWGLNRITLNVQDSIVPGAEKTFTFDVTIPETDGIFVFQWQMIQEGEEWFGAKSDIKQVLFGDPGSYLDACDATTDWKSSSAISLNTADQQQGEACIEFTASSTDEFKKTFAKSYDSRGTIENTELKFWYYVSDVSLLESNNQVELGSSGKADENEFNWSLTGLTNGWNLISLKTSEASVIGTPNLRAINWFRIYHKKTGTVTTRLDAIQVIDPTAEPLYTLLINNGSGGGAYANGETVNISAYAGAEGRLFDKWVIDSGDPVIADLNASSTTLTMSAGSAVVSATYRETQKYAVAINNGSGSGDYTAGILVVIQADAAPDGKEFDKWEVISGSVSLSNENATITYFTMPEENVEISASYKNIVSVQNKENHHALKIYPNPAKETLTLEFTIKEKSDIQIRVFDLSGREMGIKVNKKQVNPGNHQFLLPVLGLKQGSYVLKMKINDTLLTESLNVK